MIVGLFGAAAFGPEPLTGCQDQGGKLFPVRVLAVASAVRRRERILPQVAPIDVDWRPVQVVSSPLARGANSQE